jgi:hypothetical protein
VRVGGYVSDAFAEGLDVAGNLAYVAGFGRWTGSNYFGGLKIIDVSNPAHPVLVSSSLSSASDAIGRAIRVAGKYAYLGGGGAWTGSNYFGTLQIIDVSDRSNPVLVGRASTSGPVGWGLDVVGNYAYLANEHAGLEVIDVSTPGDPVRVGGIRTGYAFDVSVAGNYVYLVGGPPALQVIDVSNPADPLRVGSYDNGETGRGVQVVGKRAYVANGYVGLTVLEITALPYFRSIARTGDKLIFSWNGLPGRILQRAGSLANSNWTDVPGTDGQSRFEYPLNGGYEFFRLVER